MTEGISGFKTEVRKVCPDAKYIHYAIQTECVAFLKTGSKLKKC
jgi:hypothetical protein